MIRSAFAVLLFLPTAGFAGDVIAENATIPLAPPAAMAHAAYFTLTNSGGTPRQLVGVKADGYLMAQVHKTEVKDDIATMVSVEVIEIGPGQSVSFEQGGLHVMLMRPEAVLEEGATVHLTLEFVDGETLPVSAEVMSRKAMHAHGS